MAGDFRAYVSRRVIVQLDAYSVDGTLARESATALTLEDSAVLTDGQEPRQIDGQVVIPMVRVEWVQVI